ncbi:MAG: hypothetical protein AAB649_03645, partial [Patescibacteria group bacterium]
MPNVSAVAGAQMLHITVFPEVAFLRREVSELIQVYQSARHRASLVILTVLWAPARQRLMDTIQIFQLAKRHAVRLLLRITVFPEVAFLCRELTELIQVYQAAKRRAVNSDCLSFSFAKSKCNNFELRNAFLVFSPNFRSKI